MKTKNTNTAKKAAKKAVKNVAKEAPAKAAKAPKAQAAPKAAAKQSMPAGVKKTVTVAELVKLLKAGNTVYTANGTRHLLSYSAKVADQSKMRDVIIAKAA